MKTSTIAKSAFAAVALIASAAFAEDAAGPAVESASPVKSAEGGHGWQHHFACRADVKKLCADVRIGDGRAGIETCLSSHETELSAPCATQRTKFKAKKAEFDKACAADVQSLCAAEKSATSAEAGGHIHGVMRCLAAHKTELSDTCKTFRASMKAEWGGQHGEPAPAVKE